MKQQNQKLEQMKQEYEQIEIPKELKGQVEEAIKKAKQDKRKRKVFTWSSSSSACHYHFIK